MESQLLIGILIGLALRDIWPRALRPLRLAWPPANGSGTIPDVDSLDRPPDT